MLKLSKIFMGEFTILEEPVVPVIPSQIPAAVAADKKAIMKKMAA